MMEPGLPRHTSRHQDTVQPLLGGRNDLFVYLRERFCDVEVGFFEQCSLGQLSTELVVEQDDQLGCGGRFTVLIREVAQHVRVLQHSKPRDL